MNHLLTYCLEKFDSARSDRVGNFLHDVPWQYNATKEV